jgi:hypothetical protein
MSLRSCDTGGAFCVHPMADFDDNHNRTEVEELLQEACVAAGGEYRHAPKPGEGWELTPEQWALV